MKVPSLNVIATLKEWLSKNISLFEGADIEIRERYLPDENKGMFSIRNVAYLATIEVWGSGSLDFTLMTASADRPTVEYLSFSNEVDLRDILDNCLRRLLDMHRQA